MQVLQNPVVRRRRIRALVLVVAAAFVAWLGVSLGGR